MGASDKNLGLIVTEGSFASYSVFDCATNNRGKFLLNFDQAQLLPQEEYVFRWVIFPHKSTQDFYEKALLYPSFIHVCAEHYTVFEGEKIKMSAKSGEEIRTARVYTKERELDFTVSENTLLVNFLPEERGEYRIFVEINRHLTFADFLVKANLETLLKNRIDYIVHNQQYHNENSPLDGAFLIYDTKKGYQIFDDRQADHNACRERIGMGLLICRYLRTHKNEEYFAALEKNADFVRRKMFDAETGYVFNNLGEKNEFVRLYNAPWVAMYFVELYYLAENEKYLDDVFLLLKKYYNMGGAKFYPNAFSPLFTANAFKAAKREKEYEAVVEMFRLHADNMAKNETAYPEHEVNFEQTIVSPAVTFLSEFSRISGEDKYAREAKRHVEVLERFGANQPSCHLNEIPIRYWDDFWFGKFATMGDTFPHYWSCLSARSFNDFYKVSGEETYLKKAKECMRNCLCLFADDGRASAAYIYPYKCNGKFCEKYDDWANDQDFALYFALETGLL